MFDFILLMSSLSLLLGFAFIPAGILTHYIFKEAEKK